MLSLTRALAARQDKIRNNDKGFTLIELLVVVIIIGILAAIAIPIFLGQQDKARDGAVASAITNAKTAIVAQIVEGDDLATVVAAFPAIDSYTASDDIDVSAVLVGTDGFTITGSFGTGATNGHTISDTGAAVKTP